MTIALYGPNGALATNLVASVVKESSGKVEELRPWHSDGETDVRELKDVVNELGKFIAGVNPREVISPEAIIGCPHEEGIDYAEGSECPECPFWAKRDRFSGRPEW